jgi:hypothetical protein
LHGEARSRHQPLVTPLADKVIIVQMWIGRVDPFNFRTLTAAECLVRIQAPNSFQQSLPPQDFVQASDTSGKLVGGVEEGRVAIRDFQSPSDEILRHVISCVHCLAFPQQVHG